MRDATGRSRCFAFLTFDNADSVNAVMVREHVLDGKIVSAFILFCSDFFLFFSMSMLFPILTSGPHRLASVFASF
jgi:hypothetical protein